MSDGKRRWLGFGPVVGAGAGLLALTSTMNSAFAYGETPLADPVPSVTEVMGGAGLPMPTEDFVIHVNAYIQANLPGSTPVALFTPGGLYPFTGTKSLPFDQSVSQGVTILNDTIAPKLTAGTPVGVLGVSQSAAIASLEMSQLDPAGTPSNLPASFILIGDPMNPNGGLLERFVGLQFGSLGLTFSGATPANDFPTAIYTHEYDGIADFPRYPINFLSDLNAFLGIFYEHRYTSADLATAFALPTSGPTLTTYDMIPSTDLPLLDPLRAVPVIGNPLADLLQPDLTYIVNLGYGDPLFGYSTSPANVPTPFGLFPSPSDFQQLPGLLASGTERGIQNFIGDFTGTGPNPVMLSLGSLTSLLHPSSGTSALADLLAALSGTTNDPASLVTDFANAGNTLSEAVSTAYGTLLPTADFANALLTSVPAYDVSLFLDNLSNPIDAIGLPIAADTGLVTLVAAFELDVLASAAASIATSLMGLIPNG
jgi:PE-PPE domain